MNGWILLPAAVLGGLAAGGAALLAKNRRVPSKKASDLLSHENLAAGARVHKDGKRIIQLADGKAYSAVSLREGDCVVFDFDAHVTCNTVVLRELLTRPGSPACPLEGSVTQFSIYALIDGAEKLVYRNDKIDKYRMCTFDNICTRRLKIQLDRCRGRAWLSEAFIYAAAPKAQPFRLHDYFVYQDKCDYKTDEKFGQYLDFITDMTMFEMAQLREDGELVYTQGKAEFTRRLEAIRGGVGDRKIKLYCNLVTGRPDSAALYANRHKIAVNLAAFVSEFDLEGIEMDWEFPHGMDHKRYDQLILEIRRAFTPIDKKITLAVAVWNMRFSKPVLDAVDYFNVMIYDHGTDDFDHWHATFKHASFAVERLLSRGYPREKLCLGIPFYGREIKENKKLAPIWLDYENSGIQDPWSNLSYNGLHIAAGGVKTIQPAYYNGYALVRDKTAYAVSMSLGGVMSWHMMEDIPMDRPLSLHKAMKDACAQRLETQKLCD